MPRTARIDYLDILQHVIVRGVNRCDIFADDDDRRKFLRRFSQLLVETQTDCFAWALMSNHLHLLLRPRRSRLADLMRRLLTGYAISFNRRHGRSGHLFQNRYHSVVCDENAYLLELIRYIHLNPLRAGLVKDLNALERFSWTGHGVVLGKADLAGQVVDEVLALFGGDRSKARAGYRKFIADGIDMENHEELLGKRTGGDEEQGSNDPRILGDEEFAVKLLGRHDFHARAEKNISLPDIVQRVCNHYDLDVADLSKNIRTAKIAKARSVICYLAVREVGCNGTKIGEQINLGRAGVSRAALRGAEMIKDHPSLIRLIDE